MELPTTDWTNWDAIDWAALERLRAGFIAGSAGATDYWRRESDLASYDLTFAQRIGWKWDFVFRELQQRGWQPPAGMILDWGCGSGIAGRAFLQYFPGHAVQLWDRSPFAMRFAAQRLGGNVTTGQQPCPTLLLSHVLTELSNAQVPALLELCRAATTILWVEPGTFTASRRLIAMREQLRDSHQLVAPCVHQQACGMLTEANARHWCHFFAPSPPEVFTDGNWARFAKVAGVDLRSLPVSYLVLDRRPHAELPAGAVRVIGPARFRKGHLLVTGCDAAGVRECRLTKRVLPEQFTQFRKGEAGTLQLWHRAGDELVASQPG